MTLLPGIAPTGEPQTFEEYQLRVNPTKEALANLADQPDTGPIIMLNLLRFRPRGDSHVYSLYGKDAAGEVLKVGSFVGYYGKVIGDLDPEFGFDASWDGIVMPVYRKREAFLQLQRSPVYQRAIPYRTAGTTSRLLYVLRDTEDRIFSDTDEITRLDRDRQGFGAKAGEIFIADLLRFKTPSGREGAVAWAKSILPMLEKVGARPVLSVAAEVPVVSEEHWDHYTLIRFPSVEAVKQLYQSEDWKQALELRKAALDNSITVATAAIELPQ